MSLLSGLIYHFGIANISETMVNIANHSWLMRANILGEMISAVGVIFLGAIPFVTLSK